MTHEHLAALISAGEGKKGSDGWTALPEGRSLTIYVAAAGTSPLTISRVQAVRHDGALLHARTTKGEHFILALEDAFAGSLDAPASVTKKAGFL
jgi:hypothetical protein